MKLNLQKRLAAQILKCSEKRIQLDTTRLSDIKEAITKADIKSLILNCFISNRLYYSCKLKVKLVLNC